MWRASRYEGGELSLIPPHHFLDVRDIDGEALEEGGEEDEGDAWGILQVGNDGAAKTVCPQVTMHVVFCLFELTYNLKY